MWAVGLVFNLVLAAVSGEGALPGKGGVGDKDSGQSTPIEAVEMTICPNGQCPPFPNTAPVRVSANVPLSLVFEVPNGFPVGTLRAVVARVDENGTPIEELGSPVIDLVPGVNRINVSGVGEIFGIISLTLKSEEKDADEFDYFARLTASSTNIGNGGSGDQSSFDNASQIGVSQNLTAASKGPCQLMSNPMGASSGPNLWFVLVGLLMSILSLGLLRSKR